MAVEMGFSGKVAHKFLRSELTPLLALVGFLLGLFAILVTPREEEPQINVTFANVIVPFPGATAAEVEQLISIPAEQILSEIEGVKHVFSVSRPGLSILTIQFQVGEDRTRAIVSLYNAIFSNQDWLPPNLGVGQPIIKPKGIDDVPIVSLTLWTPDPERGAYELAQVAHAIEAEIKRIPGTRDVYTIGSPERVVRIVFDPQRLSGYGVTVNDLRISLLAANQSYDAGSMVKDQQEILVQAGEFLSTQSEIENLIIGMYQDQPIYLRDVADVYPGPEIPQSYVWFATGSEQSNSVEQYHSEYPAVTIAVAKQAGTNAVAIANRIVQRLDQLEGTFIPDGVNVTVTRNYGLTADEKARTLIAKLIFATSCVVLLVWLALGWREALIVGLAVVITLSITLFASWAWGFTLNRVSLFALIFSIGILVDDAIVVVENIHRHWSRGKSSLLEVIPQAVDEVGGPTILATFTVIAALLPMAFVSGLMGPYMSPIPINASIGMLLSLAVAIVVTPWLCGRLLKGNNSHSSEASQAENHDGLYRLFKSLLLPFLQRRQGRTARRLLTGGILVLIGLSMAMVVTQWVVLKMLPFDNKSEFQVVVDMPEGTALEDTAAALAELGRFLAQVPEVKDYQAYAGTAAPINFNGLVRQYYLRQQSHMGDIQVNLVDKDHRDKRSHEIATGLRGPLQVIGKRHNANVKIVEVPPGPPVMSPLVAEIFGLDYPGQIQVAKQIRNLFESTADVVDVDDSVEVASKRLVIKVDRAKAARLGVSQQAISRAIAVAIEGEDVGFLHDVNAKYAVPIRLEFSVEDKASIDQVLSLKLKSQTGVLVPVSEMVEVIESQREHSIYHKDLLPVVMVTGDMTGPLDSPLYGMFSMYEALGKTSLNDGNLLPQNLINPPSDPFQYRIKWDGEWQVTFETFRDMGIAYSIGLILIYLLVVAQFRSYLVPLIIMLPIPLTIIGVMPGHALLGVKFTATSMIGMIALAGIIVRNSILLVDFINSELQQGVPFQEAVIRSGSVRAKPIILTGLAAMLGAFFILDDPIFSGLAVSLIFGILVSTILTLLVIPVTFYAVMRHRYEQ